MGSISNSKFDIIIVGAGIAGLAAAIGLHQKGHHVTVLERHADTPRLPSNTTISTSVTFFVKNCDLILQP
jgi:2-polyprenyl-6-methoxyphenol hydroxylase-like FAD-dependent oxidoreductase